MNITILNDFLELPDWQTAVSKTVQGKNWEFAGFSNNVQKEIKFWYMNLDQDEFFTKKFFASISKQFNRHYELDRVYANGQTYGLSGSLHQDVIDADSSYKTFLYYPGPFWDVTYGGYTVFHDKTNDSIFSYYPTPNSAVMFDSNIWHAGLEPTRHCTDLRVTVAFKLREIS